MLMSLMSLILFVFVCCQLTTMSFYIYVSKYRILRYSQFLFSETFSVRDSGGARSTGSVNSGAYFSFQYILYTFIVPIVHVNLFFIIRFY